MKERGFIVKHNLIRDNKKANKEARDLKKSKKFNPEKKLESKTNKKELKLNLEEIEEHQEFLKEEVSLLRFKLAVEHFIHNNDNLYDKISKLDEFPVKLIKTSNSKLIYLKKFWTSDEKFLKAKKKEKLKSFKELCFKLFRDRRTKDIYFNNKIELSKVIVKIEKGLLGKDIIKGEQKRKGEGWTTNYGYNEDYLNK